MTKLVLSVVLLIIGIVVVKTKVDGRHGAVKLGGIVCLAAAVILFLMSVVITVPAGHVKVATLFGKVQDDTYREGLHIVNPLLAFTTFDLRQKTHKEQAGEREAFRSAE